MAEQTHQQNFREQYELNHNVMKAWNEQRARNEEEALRKFYERKAMFTDWAAKYPTRL